jgi:transcriptional regulator with XRE-family HTH domain
MLRSEAEYRRNEELVKDHEDKIAAQRARLKGEGWTAAAIQEALDPLLSMRDELVEEMQAYERFKRGNIGELRSLLDLGWALTAIRIARGLSQAELARRMDVHVAQVSRDERSNYHGITLDRAARVLEALGGHLRIMMDLGRAATGAEGTQRRAARRVKARGGRPHVVATKRHRVSQNG